MAQKVWKVNEERRSLGKTNKLNKFYMYTCCMFKFNTFNVKNLLLQKSTSKLQKLFDEMVKMKIRKVFFAKIVGENEWWGEKGDERKEERWIVAEEKVPFVEALKSLIDFLCFINQLMRRLVNDQWSYCGVNVEGKKWNNGNKW